MATRAESVLQEVCEGDIVVLSRDCRLHKTEDGRNMQNKGLDPFTYFELALVQVVVESDPRALTVSKLKSLERGADGGPVDFDRDTSRAGRSFGLSTARLRGIVAPQHDWEAGQMIVDRNLLLDIMRQCFD
jgi:hypothetical protein